VAGAVEKGDEERNSLIKLSLLRRAETLGYEEECHDESFFRSRVWIKYLLAYRVSREREKLNYYSNAIAI
jgi:hypothetical protein